jgi:large conductance mechanosensitive channel
MGIIQEFKTFAVKGNALDLAVGVIIGAAFGKVIDSVVKDLFNPPLGMLIGGVNFSDLRFVLKHAVPANAAEGVAAAPEVAIRYGAFCDTVIQFFIVALSVFVAVRFMNKLAEMRSLEELKKLKDIAKLGGKTGG